jgi:hypothetical protein
MCKILFMLLEATAAKVLFAIIMIRMQGIDALKPKPPNRHARA